MTCMSPLLLLLLRQGDDEFDDIDGVEEVRDLRQFILEVPLFQGMMEAEEVTILGQMPLRLACICTRARFDVDTTIPGTFTYSESLKSLQADRCCACQ